MISATSLLQNISDYCSRTGMAESTFGRRAVNDGKFTSRLRDGGRVTLETVERVQHFIATNVDPAAVAIRGAGPRLSSQPISLRSYRRFVLRKEPVVHPAKPRRAEA